MGGSSDKKNVGDWWEERKALPKRRSDAKPRWERRSDAKALLGERDVRGGGVYL